jgi:dCMP deaminase
MYKWTRRHLDTAKNISTWSKDPSRKIGAVAVGKNNNILATGYNGFPRGIEDNHRLNDRETKYKYIVHGEMNCIYNACFNGISLAGATLYVYGLPVCSECCKGIIQVGIKTVIAEVPKDLPEHWKESTKLAKAMLGEAGVVYVQYEMEVEE